MSASRAARAAESGSKLARRAERAPKPPPLVLHRFDVIAELKLRSPAAGGLATAGFDRGAQLRRVRAGGAAAVSVLTEPTEFKGELAHSRARPSCSRRSAAPRCARTSSRTLIKCSRRARRERAASS